MKEEWLDAERKPYRGLQFFDPEAQAAFKNMSVKDRLDWLQGINELYWTARIERSVPKAAEPQKNIYKK